MAKSEGEAARTSPPLSGWSMQPLSSCRELELVFPDPGAPRITTPPFSKSRTVKSSPGTQVSTTASSADPAISLAATGHCLRSRHNISIAGHVTLTANSTIVITSSVDSR